LYRLRPALTPARLLLILLVVGYASVFSYLTVVRYAAFEARALDMGNLNQAIWNTAHGDWFHLTNQPGTVNRLSLHVEPILIPISWLYLLYPAPPLLLVLQAVVVALGAIPLFALARYKLLGLAERPHPRPEGAPAPQVGEGTGSGRLRIGPFQMRLATILYPLTGRRHPSHDENTAPSPNWGGLGWGSRWDWLASNAEWIALIFAIVYLLNPTIQAANWLEFHPLTLATTFLLAAFYYLETQRPGRFALFAILAASCKEEMALLILMMGAYALLIRRWSRWGVITMVLSLAWALLAVLGIQQLFADGNIHWGRYGYLGDSPVQMVVTLLTRPGIVWAQLMAADAGGYLWSLLWPTGFLALLAPEVLILALPSLAINLLADFPPMHETHTLIYAAPIVPFVLAAAVVGFARLLAWMERLSWRGGRVLMPLMAALLLGLGMLDQRLYGYLPGSGNAMSLRVSEHNRRAAAIIAQIPADAAVSAQDRLDPHVSGRKTVYIYPRVEDARLGDADTVFLDVTGPAWPQHPNDLRASVDILLAQGFGVAAADDGYLLLRRGVENRTIPDSFYTAWRAPDINTTHGLGLRYGGLLELLDFGVVKDRYGELVVEMEWLPLARMDENLHFYVAYVAADGSVLHDNDFYQPVNVLWYPTTLWEPGIPVRIRTLPWTLDAERFALLLGVYAGENWAEGEALPIMMTDSGSTPAIPLLQGGKIARLGGYERDEAGEWQLIRDSGSTPATPLDVDFGGMIHLAGVDLPAQAQAGLELPFTLHWQASAPVDFDYTAFAQLFDAQGNKVAQLDWQPHDRLGLLPTTAWQQGQVVTDAQRLSLPPDLPAGDYTLLVGLYNWQNGERLAAQGEGVVGDNAVTLGPIRIDRIEP
jgi:uncharacterized membrane protein